MERAAGFAHDDPPQAKLDKLDALLAQSSTSAQDAALLAQMLSLPIELTPQQRRQRTLEALVLQIVALSRQNPLLMIFEDAHWTDPTTLELFGRIVDRIATHHRGGERARTSGPDLQGLPARRRPEHDEAIKGAIEGVISDMAFDLQQGTSKRGADLLSERGTVKRVPRIREFGCNVSQYSAKS